MLENAGGAILLVFIIGFAVRLFSNFIILYGTGYVFRNFKITSINRALSLALILTIINFFSGFSLVFLTYLSFFFINRILTFALHTIVNSSIIYIYAKKFEDVYVKNLVWVVTIVIGIGLVDWLLIRIVDAQLF